MRYSTNASIQTPAVGTVVPIDRVFVSINLDDETAHVAYKGATGIKWEEVSRAHGELLATLGADAQIHMGTASIRTSSTVSFAGRST